MHIPERKLIYFSIFYILEKVSSIEVKPHSGLVGLGMSIVKCENDDEIFPLEKVEMMSNLEYDHPVIVKSFIIKKQRNLRLFLHSLFSKNDIL